MQDYHIYAHYDQGEKIKPTNPQRNISRERPTKAIRAKEKSSKPNFGQLSRRFASVGAAAVINQYVGELTENKITQRRVGIAISAVGIGVMAINNPAGAAIAASALVANAGIKYNIKSYKQDLTANFLKNLSGGTYNMGR